MFRLFKFLFKGALGSFGRSNLKCFVYSPSTCLWCAESYLVGDFNIEKEAFFLYLLIGWDCYKAGFILFISAGIKDIILGLSSWISEIANKLLLLWLLLLLLLVFMFLLMIGLG